ncbi:MAG: ATP-binding protein [Candidatus Eisenbacteria bacterium]|nr:ATP-binding protein [Candidatus Eisenbacteria bacterium]
MSVLSSCKPRKEVLKGDLDDAIFAADFADLVAGKAPKVYSDPKLFFQNTHPAEQLRKVIEVVFARLAEPKEAGATLRLSTGFGGGKTHTLMALWHLANNVSNLSLGTELLPAAGRPKAVTVVAIDARPAGVLEFASHGATKVHSLWGELFFQLGDREALKSLGKADDPESSPSEDQIAAVLPAGPILILLDELVIYMAKLSERGQGNLLGFLNSLAAAVGKRPQSVLVVTDPADQRAYAKEAAKLGTELTSAAVKLDDIFGRKMTDFDPIGKETAKVIVRRLLESVDAGAAQKASAAYHALYGRVVNEAPGTVPASAADKSYSQRIVECYPFHPRLLETAEGRFAALQEFNKSRGTLRLFARILRCVWEADEDLELITAGDVDWSSDRIQGDLLQRLNRDHFKSAVTSDLEGHAQQLDGGNRGIHVRAASALLLESIAMQSNSGLDPADLTLAILRPDEAGPEPAEAMDRLVGVCWHTYPMPGGRGWQFRYEPNVNRQIEERMGSVPLEDARERVRAEAQGYFTGPTFKLVAWPERARQVPESNELQLVLCEDEKVAKQACALADEGEPGAGPMPRRFVNSIVGVAPTPTALSGAVERAQRLLAAEAIEREHRTGDSGKLVRDQLQRIKPDLQKQFRIQTCRAFDRVVLAGGVSYAIDEQFQVPDEEMLQRAQGQKCLRAFLDAKDLVYKSGDALDAGRFLKDVLQGATPLPDRPDTYTAKAIHERFLGAPHLRLLPDGAIVRQTLIKSVADGKVLIRLADGRAYDMRGCVEGAEGRRRRIAGSLSTLTLDDSVQVTRANSLLAAQWIKEDALEPYQAGRGREPTPPPPSTGPIQAMTWEKVLECALNRPLQRLRLRVRQPADAATLIALAQPLGADFLSLTVSAGGPLKDGGNINFVVSEIKPSHPVKPLAIAQTVANAVGEGVSYEAELALDFGPAGRTGLEPALRTISEEAPDGLRPDADFDAPVEVAR